MNGTQERMSELRQTSLKLGVLFTFEYCQCFKIVSNSLGVISVKKYFFKYKNDDDEFQANLGPSVLRENSSAWPNRRISASQQLSSEWAPCPEEGEGVGSHGVHLNHSLLFLGLWPGASSDQ